MPLRKQRPIQFSPKGLSDAYDSTEAFHGACQTLQNLVFDSGNPELVICRPGCTALTSFAGFTTPTWVTVYIAIGTMVYGMVATARNAGKDEPFAYNVAANTFVTISGVTSGNTPTTPSISGPWTPPTMTVVSTKILVTHPGFSGASGVYFGVIDISTPATPAWSSANTATNTLPSVPQSVANYNNRAYWACGNVTYFSDVLVPTTITNATQSLTIGDTTPIRVQSGLPVETTSGGVVGALIIIKDFQIWQVTGDSATSDLALNYISLTVGTSAPRSVAQAPYGLNFMAIDGPYVIESLGQVAPLTRGTEEINHDIQNAFIFCSQPSRVSAGYSGGIYRICVDTVLKGQASTNDYWFDTARRRWNGPHTFHVDCSTPVGSYFVVSHRSYGAVLYKSQIEQDSTSVFTENGSPTSFALESSTFPKDITMTEKQVVESTIELASSGSVVNYQVTALNGLRTQMNSVVIPVNGQGTLWGASTWGGGTWSSPQNIPNVYSIPWQVPLVFQKMAIQVSGTCASNISIGSFFARYQETGYMNMGS